MPLSVADIAAQLGLRIEGDAETLLDGVGTLASAGPSQLSFYANKRHKNELPVCKAGAVILRESDAENFSGTALISEDPYWAYSQAAAMLRPAVSLPRGIHPSAQVDPSCTVDESASIAALSVIGPGCTIAAGVQIGPSCVLGANVTVGEGSRLVARVYLGDAITLGQRVLVHPGAVIGADGFGLVMHEGRWHKVPQLGAVRIGDDCEIGANTTIDRGAIEDTVLDEDVRLDNLIQVAHNCQIGAHTAIAGNAGLAGSAKVGKYCTMAGSSGLVGHIELTDNVHITGLSMVTKSISEPGVYSSGLPALPHSEWQRILAYLRKLRGLFSDVRGLLKSSD